MALTHERHVHHSVAGDWFSSLETDVRFCFCRFTRLGLLRLLTAEPVMGDEVLTQAGAWTVYDRWLQDERVSFIDEPHGTALSRAHSWADRGSKSLG